MVDMTFEDCLALLESSAPGCLLNNLFQLSSGSWRCNLRTLESAFDFFDGPTPSAAILGAIEKTKGPSSPTIRNSPRAVAKGKMSGDELLTSLGLI